MTAGNLRIILVRHGQTDSNKQHILQGQIDTPLNDTGRLQAIAGGKRLIQERIELDAVWSSDLIRCRETTKLILSESEIHKKLDVTYQADLRERNMGELEGMRISDARTKAMREGKTFHQYGESKKVAVRRLNSAFDKILNESVERKYTNIMIVSHGGKYERVGDELYWLTH